MKTLLTLSVLLSIYNFSYTTDCAHAHDTNNVSHQFYNALVETPKDAVVKGAVATKDLAKTVAAAVVLSNAGHELKDAAKELVIDAPVKTVNAIKNGALKAYDSTKEGAKIAYKTAVVKPARAIKDAAHEVAESEFVQGTKETAVEVGEQFAEVGQDVWDTTKFGIQRAYHLLVEKPVGAVKAAGNYLAHGAETQIAACETKEKFIVIYEGKIAATVEPTLVLSKQHAITTISVMSPAVAQAQMPGVYVGSQEAVDPNLAIEFTLKNPSAAPIVLSDSTLNLLSQAYDSVASDLNRHQ